jgi:hypothetical protein
MSLADDDDNGGRSRREQFDFDLAPAQWSSVSLSLLCMLVWFRLTIWFHAKLLYLAAVYKL